jgi:hypothetical protein
MTPERRLRQFDKALRLRQSQEGQAILLERKTFCGNYGDIGPGGVVWSKDAGRRREEGHVLILSIHPDEFNVDRLISALREADTWRSDVPLWRQAEIRDEKTKERKIAKRKDFIRYKAENLWNNYCWRQKSRVSVQERIA